MATVPASDLPSNLVPASDLPSNAAFSPVQMLLNAPKSLYKNTLGGLVDLVSSPLQSLTGAADIVAGGVYNALPTQLQQALNAIELNPEAQQRAINMAKIVGKDYAKTYGTKQGFQQTLQEDPFRIAGDVSLLATGGASAASRLPTISSGLRKVADVTNPFTAAQKVVQYTPPLVSNATTGLLGMTTGVGPETIQTAFESGKRGASAFVENLRGNVPKTEVLDQARQALQNMRADKSINYQIGIADTAVDAKRLNFKPIEDQFSSLVDSLYHNGKAKIGDSEIGIVKQVSDVINEWKVDPSSHTPIGLDALKQRLDAIYPESPKQTSAQRVITSMRNKVKDLIVEQSPEYAKTMAAYEQAITLEKEIERALSLGKQASADTALRKLTSLARNNVNANYGYRLDLAKALEKQGGADLLPAIAGQSMASILPRGLAPQIAGATQIPSALQSIAVGVTPTSLLAAPLFSPRLVGEAAYGAGNLLRKMSESKINQSMAPTIANAQRLYGQIPLTAEQQRFAYLLGAKSAQPQGLLGQ